MAQEQHNTRPDDSGKNSPKPLSFNDLEEGMRVVEVNTALSEDDPTVNAGKIVEIGSGESELRNPGEDEARFKYNNGVGEQMFGPLSGGTYSRLKKEKVNNSDNLDYYTPEEAKKVDGVEV